MERAALIGARSRAGWGCKQEASGVGVCVGMFVQQGIGAFDYAYFMNFMFSFHGCLEDSHDVGPGNRSTKPGGKAWRFEGSQGAGGGIHDLTRGECHR